MFRFMRPAKTFLSVSRAPIRVESQIARGEVFKVQNVRMQRKVRARSVIASAAAIYFSYMVWAKICLDPVLQALVDATPDPDSDEAAEVPPLFIPLPGTTKELKPRRYQVTDPEVQTALKIFRAPDKVHFVKEELANLVVEMMRGHPMLTKRFGTDMVLSRYWFNVSFAMYPHPLYVRTGIKIADDYVALAVEPVDPQMVYKLRQALWPSGMAMGVWSFAKVMVTEDLKKLSRALGFQPSGNVTVAELVAKQQEQAAKLPISRLPHSIGERQAQKGSVLTRENSSGDKKPPAQDEGHANGEKTNVSRLPLQVSMAFSAFFNELLAAWKPPPRFPPLGCLATEGLIEVEAPREYIVCKVTAYFNPKTNSYDRNTLRVTMVQMHGKQNARESPKGNLSR